VSAFPCRRPRRGLPRRVGGATIRPAANLGAYLEASRSSRRGVGAYVEISVEIEVEISVEIYV
jgi:hypothetical protein